MITILRTVMEGYAGLGINSVDYLTENSDSTVFAIVGVSIFRQKRTASAGLIVRIVADQIVIEADLNNKILFDALVDAGIPRENIILAYAGEEAPPIPTIVLGGKADF